RSCCIMRAGGQRPDLARIHDLRAVQIPNADTMGGVVDEQQVGIAVAVEIRGMRRDGDDVTGGSGGQGRTSERSVRELEILYPGNRVGAVGRAGALIGDGISLGIGVVGDAVVGFVARVYSRVDAAAADD